MGHDNGVSNLWIGLDYGLSNLRMGLDCVVVQTYLPSLVGGCMEMWTLPGLVIWAAPASLCSNSSPLTTGSSCTPPSETETQVGGVRGVASLNFSLFLLEQGHIIVYLILFTIMETFIFIK